MYNKNYIYESINNKKNNHKNINNIIIKKIAFIQ